MGVEGFVRSESQVVSPIQDDDTADAPTLRSPKQSILPSAQSVFFALNGLKIRLQAIGVNNFLDMGVARPDQS